MIRRQPVQRRLGRAQPRLHPAQVIVLSFSALVALGTLLLLLPISQREETGVVDALFTATSAVSVTGLTTVDTATHWTVFGQVVMLVLVQIGGLGVMSAASLLGLLVARRLGLRSQITAETERGHVGTSDVRTVLIAVLWISLAVELIVAVLLTVRWSMYDDFGLARAAWFGTFHAITAYNNAGFGLLSDNLTRFQTDAAICLPISAGLVVGGLGFPVLAELRREWRSPKHWSLTTKIVLSTTATLLIGGTVAFALFEWGNHRTLGPLSPLERLLASFFYSANTRTAGFNSLDVGGVSQESWLISDILMFIGAAPAGTSGGIKVTTFAVLYFIVRGELRGDRSVGAFRRRIPPETQRQAVTVAATASMIVVGASLALEAMTPFDLERSGFEVISAFSTVGLTTGITPDLPDPAKLLVAALMLGGRLGVMTLGTAIALRTRTRAYEHPAERPLIS